MYLNEMHKYCCHPDFQEINKGFLERFGNIFLIFLVFVNMRKDFSLLSGFRKRLKSYEIENKKLETKFLFPLSGYHLIGLGAGFCTEQLKV